MKQQLKHIFSLLFLVFSYYSNSQSVRLYLNGDSAAIKKIDCWNFSKMNIKFDYQKKVTEGGMVGVILSVENQYNTLNFLGELDLKEVKQEGKKNKFVDVPVFKTTDPREETNFYALMSGTELTRGTMYYEIDSKGDDTTWLTISVVTQEKEKKASKKDKENEEGDDEKDEKKDDGKDEEMIGMYDVVMSSGKIKMLNRSWIANQEWTKGPDIPLQAGNCAGYKITAPPDGDWIRKNAKGNIVAKGKYLNGLRVGIWLQYTEDGKYLKEVRHYNKGTLNGSCTRYNNEGIIEEKGNYLEGKRHGTWFLFAHVGEPEYVSEYNKGLLVRNPQKVGDESYETNNVTKRSSHNGPWIEYNRVSYDSCFYKKGKKEGEMVKYQHGILIKSGNYVEDEEIGKWQEYNERGVLTKEIFRKEHSEWGSYKEYEDGILEEEGQKIKGQREGVWKTYDCSKHYLQEEETWQNNERTGPFTTYYENGKIKVVGSHLKGRYDGPYKEYFDNGKISEEGDYKFGDRIGSWKIYSSSGELNETKKY